MLIQVEAGVSRYHEDRGRVTSSDFHVVIVIVHDSNSDTDSVISVVNTSFSICIRNEGPTSHELNEGIRDRS